MRGRTRLQEGMRKCFEVMEMFYISIIVVKQVYMFIKTLNSAHKMDAFYCT